MALPISTPLGKIKFAFPFTAFMELMIKTQYEAVQPRALGPASLRHGPPGQLLLDAFFVCFLAFEVPLHWY